MKTALFTFILIFLFSCKDPTIACFSHSPDTITTNVPVTFNAGCSDEASYYTWNFGDGSYDTTTTALTITHEYTITGTFIIRLNVKRKDGNLPRGSKTESTELISVQ